LSAPTEGRYLSGRALVQALSAKRGTPVSVHLQVADRCNHSCQHCYQIQGLKGELSLDDLRALLDDIAAAGVLTLNVSGGEATLRHDLLDILSHARARGFAVRLYTNAFLIDDAYAKRLSSIGLYEVHVSVYSAIGAEHDAVTRVPGSFVKTVAGIRALRRYGLRVIVKNPQTSLSTEGAVGVERLARDLDCSFRAGATLTAMEDGSLAPLAVAASPEQLVASGLLTPWKPQADAARERSGRLEVNPCGVGRSGLVVLPDGEVLPCTDTPVRVGNARTEGMRPRRRLPALPRHRAPSGRRLLRPLRHGLRAGPRALPGRRGFAGNAPAARRLRARARPRHRPLRDRGSREDSTHPGRTHRGRRGPRAPSPLDS
jgi:MoaA/NifB/PqqE/SkfB family radical SAM enzyme